MTEQSALRVGTGAVAITTSTVLPVFLLGALSVQVGAELRFDPAALGLVVSAYFGVSALVSLPVGKLVERLGSRRTSRIALVGAAVAMLLTAVLARSYAAVVAVVAVVLLGAWTNVMGSSAPTSRSRGRCPRHDWGCRPGSSRRASRSRPCSPAWPCRPWV